MNKRPKLKLILLGSIGFSLLPMDLSAITVSINSRAGLGAEDSINWSTAGAAFNQIASNPFTISSGGGRSASVSMAAGLFERADEGTGWTGNFALGDALLWTAFESGPLSIEFTGGSVFGGGAQIQTDALGAFSGTISAYDIGGALLGTHVFTGNSSQAQDNSALFVGIQSDAADIARIEFNITASTEPLLSFAINEFSLDTQRQAIGVPDAGSSALLLGLGMLAVGTIRRQLTVTE